MRIINTNLVRRTKEQKLGRKSMGVVGKCKVMKINSGFKEESDDIVFDENM